MEFTKKQHDAILAGLRLLQVSLDKRQVLPDDGDIGDILTDSGCHPGLTAEEIDALCEEINQPDTLAQKALEIALAREAADDPEDPLARKSLEDLLLDANLFHVRDEANMRHSCLAAHNVLCFTFADRSRLVRFVQHLDRPNASAWAAIPAGAYPF